MVQDERRLPQLQDFGTCYACGQRIGWVVLNPGRSRRPVDPEPKPRAEYALLRNGRTAVNLRDGSVDDQFERYDGPRFWDHTKTCPVPSMRTAAAGIGMWLGELEGRPPTAFTARREARRQALLRERAST